MTDNKNKREIDYEKTEEHLKTIVKEYPEVPVSEYNKSLMKKDGIIDPKVAYGYKVKEILEIYKKLYEETQALPQKEIKKGTDQRIKDLNSLKDGSYYGDINGKRVNRYPLDCGYISLKGYSLDMNDPEKKGYFVQVSSPTRQEAYKFVQPQRTFDLSGRNSSIIIYDVFFDVQYLLFKGRKGLLSYNEAPSSHVH